MKKLFLFLIILLPLMAYAAVGCDLNDPDRDVKRFFPESTSYLTKYETYTEPDGSSLPITFYTIYQDKKIIGYIHGTNQKGQYGGIQVFIAVSQTGAIQHFYYQRLTSRQAALFKTPSFSQQFIGLTSKTFAKSTFKNPAPSAEKDYQATLAGIKKNFLLLDLYIFHTTGGN